MGEALVNLTTLRDCAMEFSKKSFTRSIVGGVAKPFRSLHITMVAHPMASRCSCAIYGRCGSAIKCCPPATNGVPRAPVCVERFWSGHILSKLRYRAVKVCHLV